MDFGVAVDECQVLSLFLREFHFIFSHRTVEVRGAPKVLLVKAAGFFASPQLTCSLTHLMYFLSKCTCARNKAAIPAACTISEEMVISSSLIPPTLP